MDWNDVLAPTTPRLIIFVLLVSYGFFTIPFITLHSESCREEGIGCSFSDHRVSLFYCVDIDFHTEYHTMYMYSSKECSKSDVLWLFLIIPLLYLVSFPLYEKLQDTVDAWNYGARKGLVICGLLIFTMLPALILGIMAPGSLYSPISAYTAFPLGLFYLCAHMLAAGMFIIPLGVALILAVVAYSGLAYLRMWEINHPTLYVLWMLYIVVALLGTLLV